MYFRYSKIEIFSGFLIPVATHMIEGVKMDGHIRGYRF